MRHSLLFFDFIDHDFKGIIDINKTRELLSEWTITRSSDRCFEIEGRKIENMDWLRLWNNLEQSGHLFLYDYQDETELYLHRARRENKSRIAKDADLDNLTVQLILETK
jgi:hypothetical protein